MKFLGFQEKAWVSNSRIHKKYFFYFLFKTAMSQPLFQLQLFSPKKNHLKIKKSKDLFLESAEIFKPSVGYWTMIGNLTYPRWVFCLYNF